MLQLFDVQPREDDDGSGSQAPCFSPLKWSMEDDTIVESL